MASSMGFKLNFYRTLLQSLKKEMNSFPNRLNITKAMSIEEKKLQESSVKKIAKDIEDRDPTFFFLIHGISSR